MSQIRFVTIVCLLLAGAARTAAQGSLPSPLTLADVIRIAAERRDEIAAANARVMGAAARPAIVSALDDPMISPALDHLPFMGGGADVSFVVEQQFPLSDIRAHRKSGALAGVDRMRADARRVALDVSQDAARAFLMLQERRRAAALINEQLPLSRGLVAAANARYSSGTAPQSDVLRAELEVARLESQSRAIAGEIRAAEAMLNVSLAVDVDDAVPTLAPLTADPPVPSWQMIRDSLTARPELVAAKAEIARAEADVQVMRDMFRPMLSVRTGPSYTMTEGTGWMAMVGVTLPIRRDKLRAGVAEAEAMRSMSSADLRAMTRMIEGQAAAAIGQLQAARDRRTAITTNVLPRARLAIDPAIAGYAAGQLPLVSVIEAIQALWTVQSDLIDAETALGAAWVQLGRAIGSYEGLTP